MPYHGPSIPQDLPVHFADPAPVSSYPGFPALPPAFLFADASTQKVETPRCLFPHFMQRSPPWPPAPK